MEQSRAGSWAILNSCGLGARPGIPLPLLPLRRMTKLWLGCSLIHCSPSSGHFPGHPFWWLSEPPAALWFAAGWPAFFSPNPLLTPPPGDDKHMWFDKVKPDYQETPQGLPVSSCSPFFLVPGVCYLLVAPLPSGTGLHTFCKAFGLATTKQSRPLLHNQ